MLTARRGRAAHERFESKVRDAKRKGKTIDIDDLPRRELLIRYFETRGYVVVHGTSKLYVTMEKPGEPGKKYFIGKNGGVWFGRNVSEKIGYPKSFNWDGLRKYLKKVAEVSEGE